LEVLSGDVRAPIGNLTGHIIAVMLVDASTKWTITARGIRGGQVEKIADIFEYIKNKITF
jgi:hypothetical protein